MTIDERERGWLNKLRDDGIVVIPGDVSKPCAKLVSAYGITPENFQNDGGYNRFACNISLAPVRELATADRLLRLLSFYYGAQPYLRHLPKIHVTYPVVSEHRKGVGEGYAHHWHYDTPNQVTAMILLEDLTVEQPHMIYAKKSHKLRQRNISKKDQNFSDKTVLDTFDIEHCIGKKGSIIVFDPNGLHKLKVVENASRVHMHLNFVPGNNIVYSETPTEPKFKVHGKPIKLSKLQAESLRYMDGFYQT